MAENVFPSFTTHSKHPPEEGRMNSGFEWTWVHVYSCSFIYLRKHMVEWHWHFRACTLHKEILLDSPLHPSRCLSPGPDVLVTPGLICICKAHWAAESNHWRLLKRLTHPVNLLSKETEGIISQGLDALLSRIRQAVTKPGAHLSLIKDTNTWSVFVQILAGNSL